MTSILPTRTLMQNPEPGSAAGSSTMHRTTTRVVVAALLAACVGAMFSGAPREVVGLAAVGMLVLLMLIKLPVAIALAVPSVIGVYALAGDRAAVNMLAHLPYDTVASWSLSVLPMFVFMGLLLAKSGVATKIYVAARQWLSWLPGGLAIGTNSAGAGMAAVSGSTIGITYTLGRIGIPEMLRAGYDKRMAVGSVIVACLPGHLIPPSILLVIYAGIANVPVGPQLVAGIVPGILIALFCSVVIFAVSVARPSLAGRNAPLSSGSRAGGSSKNELGRSLLAIWPIPLLIVAVVVSMLTGLLTATEAGAGGALLALIVTVMYKRKNGPFAVVADAATETVRTVGAIFFLIIGAYMLTRLLSISGLATGFSDWITSLGLSRVEFLLIMMVAYLVMGAFMDSLSMMLLTIPLLIPTLAELEISLIWFGVFAVLLGELGMITPPVGIICYIVHSIVKDPMVNQGHDITLRDVIVSILLFLPVVLVFIGVLIAFPGIVTFLPDLIS
ncbi:TRAP transporter large permease [Hoyosella sp. YIM 151337]|uniref:TRAP transporter large permease n=1 Tax=Hoyosella sp. YIM 151337 TaxID=2992742 RepID=UPI0022363975|nr:TRAP transporter large permease [Hoyosella sp. YIM 151337]MCW4355935.1 TRAP transporter large permease [Hoyosella sp. YIM 151337]